MSLPRGKRSIAQAASGEVSTLVALLEEEVEVVKALIAAASTKKDAIVARDSARIEEAVKREAELLEALQALEEKRSAWVEHWTSTSFVSGAAKKREAGAPPTVSELATSLAEPEAQAVRRVAGELEALLGELDELNRENAALLFHSLAFIQAMIDAITGADEKTNVYGPKARRSGAAKATVEWRA